MNCSVIITTYNRPNKVIELVNQLKQVLNDCDTIIVVDSSDENNLTIQKMNGVDYLKSSHKNQPYQRYLGCLKSKSDILLFLDDDMEVADKKFIVKLKEIFKDKKISGVAIHFEDLHKDTLLNQVPKTNLLIKDNSIKKIISWFTGYPKLKEGKLGLCGNRGVQPENGKETEWVSGGSFASRRLDTFVNFNFQLFDLFERKIGMGEDVIIGHTISKQGSLIYNKEVFFLHNDQKDSTYVSDIYYYAKRVSFSRLYLSLEKSRLNGQNLLFARMHYHYYTFFRIIGLIINMTILFDKKRWEILKGSLSGWKMSINFRFDNQFHQEKKWIINAKSDIENI